MGMRRQRCPTCKKRRICNAAQHKHKSWVSDGVKHVCFVCARDLPRPNPKTEEDKIANEVFYLSNSKTKYG